jgi:hypothetical protein
VDERKRESERERREAERKWAGGGPCFKVTAAKALGCSE